MRNNDRAKVNMAAMVSARITFTSSHPIIWRSQPWYMVMQLWADNPLIIISPTLLTLPLLGGILPAYNASIAIKVRASKDSLDRV